VNIALVFACKAAKISIADVYQRITEAAGREIDASAKCAIGFAMCDQFMLGGAHN